MTSPKYSYPIQGIFYFFMNPSIWLKCICALLVTLLVAICSLIGFGFLITPQTHGLIRIGCPVWLAWLIGISLYLLESCVFVLLFSLIGLPFFQDSLFDYVLVLRGYQGVLENNHTQACSRGFRAGIGYLLVQIILLIISIPINFIPFFGTYLFCYLNGFVLAWGYQIHDHVDLKGMSFAESKRYVFEHKRQFTGFGIVAFTLEMIPLFNFLFIFTNTIGAALWAADEYGSAHRIIIPTNSHLENGLPNVYKKNFKNGYTEFSN